MHSIWTFNDIFNTEQRQYFIKKYNQSGLVFVIGLRSNPAETPVLVWLLMLIYVKSRKYVDHLE